MNAAVFQPDSSQTFQFTPLTWAVLLAKAYKLAEAAAFTATLSDAPCLPRLRSLARL